MVLIPLLDKQIFYTLYVALVQNRLNLLLICNTALIFLVVCCKFIQRLFFGPLNSIELEHLRERGWYTTTEFMLASLVFRENISLQFCAMFMCILFVKGFHWLISDRVEFIFRPIPDSKKLPFHHIRLISAIFLLYLTDIKIIRLCLREINEGRRSVLVTIFGFEICVLFNSLVATTFHYLLNHLEVLYIWSHYTSPRPKTWPQKRYFLFIVKLLNELCRLSMYLYFSAILLGDFCIPIHLFRETYVTLKLSITKTREFIRPRGGKSHLTAWLFEDALEDNLINEDLCIICRERMILADSRTNEKLVPKVLPCNHVFHYGCFSKWSECSTECPTCRRKILKAKSVPVAQL